MSLTESQKGKIKSFHSFLMKIGAACNCHQRPDRSFFIKGYQLPLCARCTGVVLGYFLGIIILFKALIPPAISVLMLLPMYTDWKLQYEGILESSNLRRLITGSACGMGYLHLVIQIILFFISKIGEFLF